MAGQQRIHVVHLLIRNNHRMLILTQPIFLLLIGICFILSISTQEKQPLKILLPLFFGLLLFVESVCYYLKIADVNNLIIYNLWFPVEFIFYSYWVVAYFNSRYFKKLFIFLIPIYATTVIVIYLLSNTLFKFNSLAFQLGFLLLLPVILFKLYEYVNESIIHNPLKVPVFWLITGLLISYVFSLSQFSIQDYLNYNNKNLSEALKKVNIILKDILYMCIIIYFILKWKNKRSHT